MVKYEDVYIKAYENGTQLWKGLDQYFKFYNQERPHEALDYQVPAKVFGIT